VASARGTQRGVAPLAAALVGQLADEDPQVEQAVGPRLSEIVTGTGAGHR
jgi:hypothetical protein